jgi:hypothetical protein
VFPASLAQGGQVVRSQDDDGELGEMLVKFHGSFEAVHLRHLEIHQDHVGAPPFDGGERLLTTVRGGYDLKDRIAFKKATKGMQECGRIVHSQHPNVLCCYLRHFDPRFLLKGNAIIFNGLHSLPARLDPAMRKCFSPFVRFCADTT